MGARLLWCGETEIWFGGKSEVALTCGIQIAEGLKQVELVELELVKCMFCCMHGPSDFLSVFDSFCYNFLVILLFSKREVVYLLYISLSNVLTIAKM